MEDEPAFLQLLQIIRDSKAQNDYHIKMVSDYSEKKSLIRRENLVYPDNPDV